MPYQLPQMENSAAIERQSSLTRESTAGLLGTVLTIVGASFVLTAAGAYLFRDLSNGIALFLLLGNFLVLFGLQRAARSGDITLQLGLMGLFAFVEGAGLAPLLQHYVRTIGPTKVAEAAALTGFGMFTMGMAAYVWNINYRRWAGVLFGALLGVIILSVVGLFVHFISPSAISWLVLLVFTGLTIADFARIRAGGDGAGPVQLAVSIYLDGLNIFLAILQLMGGGRRSN